MDFSFITESNFTKSLGEFREVLFYPEEMAKIHLIENSLFRNVFITLFPLPEITF